MALKLLGIVGSYRKDGVIDQIITALLEEAEKENIQTDKIYLKDMHIEFCKNCRNCTQQNGAERGKCIHHDDMEGLLKKIDSADIIAIGAPVNFFNINAMTRKFMERLLPYAYWPWGKQMGPVMRTKVKNKKAILITSSAMPGFIGMFATGAMRALKIIAKTIGAKPVGSIFLGFAASDEKANIRNRIDRKVKKIVHKLK